MNQLMENSLRSYDVTSVVTSYLVGLRSCHSQPAIAKVKDPHRYVERGLPVFSPLYLGTCVFLYNDL